MDIGGKEFLNWFMIHGRWKKKITRYEIFNKLDDGGDDWFAEDKISEVKDIIKDYIEE